MAIASMKPGMASESMFADLFAALTETTVPLSVYFRGVVGASEVVGAGVGAAAGSDGLLQPDSGKQSSAVKMHSAATDAILIVLRIEFTFPPARNLILHCLARTSVVKPPAELGVDLARIVEVEAAKREAVVQLDAAICHV
jgi:hypothetical protein